MWSCRGEEYWGVCNGTYIQGRFIRASLRKEMLHFSRVVRVATGVYHNLHSADDARPLTFLSISLFFFSLNYVAKQTTHWSALQIHYSNEFPEKTRFTYTTITFSIKTSFLLSVNYTCTPFLFHAILNLPHFNLFNNF